ncbi:interleukin-4 isoform X3 [Phacochoerus africanus]|uniref:interleukin-4 isoform X3 n=1 Tax=Phacochoerus africanus TaxID=41426 RepID=UPI001FD8D078|nr:interleukin-4 isoform X3 [Phacochoerus africanus]
MGKQWGACHPRAFLPLRGCRRFSQQERVRAALQGLVCAVGGNALSCSLVPAWAKNSCMELPVTDVFAAPENTTEKETFCRASTVLRHIYRHHTCMKSLLSGLDRNLSSMANMTCSVHEAKKSTLKDFLERLKTIMKEKYSKC